MAMPIEETPDKALRPRVLLLVDVQNVFYGAKNYTEENSIHALGIDYAKLPEWIAKTIDPALTGEDIDKFAYVIQTPRYKGLAFFSLLKRLGYDLKVRHCDASSEDDTGSVTSMMQLDLLCNADKYDHVVVVSGSGVFVPAFQAVKKNGATAKCTICAFPRTIHAAFKECKYVDKILLLNTRVLRD